MSDRLDMTLTYALHNALRRELGNLARVTARPNLDPRTVLRTTPGWGMLRSALHAHQAAEDAALWPPLRRALAGRPFDLTRLEANEAEHVALLSLVRAIDGALADPGIGLGLIGDLTGSLITGLGKHLDHEEQAVLPLVQAALSQEQWDLYRRVHTRRIASGTVQLLPWLLHDADEGTVTCVLAQFPTEPPVPACVYRGRSAFGYDLWGVEGLALPYGTDHLR
ncbi:hemerythrin domain-containing protein [Streptomyces sp. NPDC054961]